MTKDKLTSIILAVIATGVMAICGFLFSQLDALATDVSELRVASAVVTGNRFTSNDWLDVSKELNLSFSEIRKELAAIRESIAKLPTDIPPQWFIDRVDGIEHRLNLLHKSKPIGGYE